MPTLITLLDPATETAIKWKGGLVNSSKVGGRVGVPINKLVKLSQGVGYTPTPKLTALPQMLPRR